MNDSVCEVIFSRIHRSTLFNKFEMDRYIYRCVSCICT